MFEEKIVWHEVTARALTDEEKAKFAEWCEPPLYMIDGSMPEDGQEILIATKYGVEFDTNYIDCDAVGNLFYLDGRGDWDEVLAWAEMPKYKEDSDGRG